MKMVAQKFESFQDVKDEEYRYWASVSPSERFAAGHQMSVEHYGMPIGDLRDGPVCKYVRNPDGTKTLISEWSGPNPLRSASSSGTV
jgi:hypothetical protein